ncbi:MAG: hypothetical protein MJ228_03205 [Bacilli bacterium]|nr:hypothetical protein [Bacilli bacterium]
MYYVIHTMTGEENKLLDRIGVYVNKNTFTDIFVPVRKREKKINGEWTLYEERWFPGYVFVETTTPREFVAELSKLEGYKRLVGYRNERLEKISYIPLSPWEEKYLDKLLRRDSVNKSKTVDITKIAIEEGKQIKVIDGPLFGLDATIVKYDLHKRVAVISFEMFGQKVETQVGIDIVIEKDDINYQIN